MSKEELDNITDFLDSQPTKKTNGKRNRTVGNNLERELVNILKVTFPNIATSRNVNRVRDGEGVDLINKDESKYGRLPYNFQAKCLAKHVEYTKVLAAMPKDEEINVVIHRKTKKNESNGRFMSQGTYAIMNAEDFYKIIAELKIAKELVEHWHLDNK